LRGCSLSAVGAVSAGADGVASTALGIAGAVSGVGLVMKLTFSRTVERRRAVFSASAAASSDAEAATGSGCAGSGAGGSLDTPSDSAIVGAGSDRPSKSATAL
jgi:hypothetical protein